MIPCMTVKDLIKYLDTWAGSTQLCDPDFFQETRAEIGLAIIDEETFLDLFKLRYKRELDNKK